MRLIKKRTRPKGRRADPREVLGGEFADEERPAVPDCGPAAPQPLRAGESFEPLRRRSPAKM